MNAVVLVEFGNRRNAIEEERYQAGVLGFSHVDEDLSETVGVTGAQVGRRLHAGENDVRLGVALARPVDDLREVVFERLSRESAQPVVRAEFENEGVEGRIQEPIESIESAGRRDKDSRASRPRPGMSPQTLTW